MLCVCMFETMESKCVLSVFGCYSTSHYKLDIKVDRSVISNSECVSSSAVMHLGGQRALFPLGELLSRRFL